MGRVRAYLAMSLDGFVAGERDDLSWLEPRAAGAAPVAVGPWSEGPDGEPLGFDDFLAGVGCILMGRRTFDIVTSFADWPYGDTPMLVATHRPLTGSRAGVSAAAGGIEALVASAQATAGDADVYVDGAATVRSALAAGVLDHLVATVVPTVLGRGTSLFAGLSQRRELTVEKVARFGEGFIQVHLAAR
ncbi:dihydrofolate reductase family protein [Demequina lignilytica]|uniref:Dihydrofolate reductase family protein n=1 Tax=Demequina lignilytica TaxID=3051663 RepID=A0AB35MF08_9MICO|nr:dihydrofolate reductase family protein [Demequina sp. SYSU T0a273]MDN4482352.1 dihydrofolate reductase family protein [Demequina sp. SYSU T0a273]